MEFAGEFETHLTVRLAGTGDLERLQEWSNVHGLKCLHIVLDRGTHPSQPMLTRRGSGTLSGEIAAALAVRDGLADGGFSVTRIKIEAAPWNGDIPQSALDVGHDAADRYFEHHVKLLLLQNAGYASLLELAQRHNAHLSRNALQRRLDGCEERFITQRCRSVGQCEARHQLNALLGEVQATGHPVLAVEEEYVVYDSNVLIDAGWIESEAR